MDQAAIFLYFTLFSTGLASLVLSVLIYLRYGNRMIKYYFFLFSVFTVKVLANNIMLYNVINSGLQNSGIILIINAVSYDIILLTLFLLPVLLHNLLAVKYKRIKNIFVYCFMTVTGFMLLYPYFYRLPVERQTVTLYPAFDLVLTGIPVVIIVYSFLLIFIYFNKAGRELKELAVMLLLFFSTLLIYDNTVPQKLFIFSTINGVPWKLVIFSFCFYLAWNIFFLAYSSKYMFHRPLGNMETIPDTGYLEKNNITGREKEIILLILQGKSNPEIAEILFISLKTVKSHVYNVYKKTGVKSRMELSHLVHEYNTGRK